MAITFDHLIPSGDKSSGSISFDHLIPDRSSESGYVREIGKGVASGATGLVGSAMQGLALPTAEDPREAEQYQSLVAELPNVAGMSHGEFVDFQRRATQNIRGGRELNLLAAARKLRDGSAKPEDFSDEFLDVLPKEKLQDTGLYQSGSKVQEFAERNFPASDDFKDSWTRAISEGLGSTAPLFLTGPFGPVTGAALGAGVGMAASSGEAVNRAIGQGATEQQIQDAGQLAQYIGITDQIPIEVLLDRVPLPVAKPFGRVLGKIINQAAAEGGQEGAQQALQNVVERYVYDPDQGIMDGVASAAGVGMATGGVMGAAVSPFSGKEPENIPFTSQVDPDPERVNSPRLTDADRESPIPNALIDDGKAIIERRLSGAEPAATDAELIAAIEGGQGGDGQVTSIVPDERLPAIPVEREQPAQANPFQDLIPEDSIVGESATADGADANTPVLSGRDAIPEGDSRAQGTSSDTAVTEKREVPVKYQIVEAQDLVASQSDDGATANANYPSEMQPRDRSRAVSRAQILEIAQKLNPRLLDRSAKASDGAPVVGKDGVVESGNGRVLAIRHAYKNGMPGAETYRKYLIDQGYDLSGINQPVLVRVRQNDITPQDRQAFTREANERDTLAMSATERAMADAQAMPDGLIDLYRGGDVDAVQNRDFVRKFLSASVGKGDMATMIDGSGQMSQDAVRRVQGALLAKAYGDPDLVGTMLESSDNDIKQIGGAALDIAPIWAQMRSEAGRGEIASTMDQTPRFLDAVRMVADARRSGRKLSDLVGQRDAFTGDIDPVTEGFLRLMFRDTVNWTRPVSRKRLTESMSYFLDQARQTTPGVDMLGATAPAPTEILGNARKKLEQSYGSDEQQAAIEFGPSRDEGTGGSIGNASQGRTEQGLEDRQDGERGEVAGAGESVKDWLARGAKQAEKARDYVLTKGRETGNEHLVGIATDGTEYRGSGTSRNVKFPVDWLKKLTDPEQSIVAHHNHPNGTSLSPQDINMIAVYPGLSAVYAYGHSGDGSTYRATLSPEWRSRLHGIPARDKYSVFSPLVDWVKNYSRRNLASLVKDEEISSADASQLFMHIQNTILDKLGVIDYRTDFTHPAMDSDPVRDIISKIRTGGSALSIAKDKLQRLQAINGQDANTSSDTHDRRANPVRFYGDLAKLPGGDNQTSAEFDEAKRSEKRQSDDTREEKRGEPELTFAENGAPFTAPAVKSVERISAALDKQTSRLKGMGGKVDKRTKDDGETSGQYLTRKFVDYLEPLAEMQREVETNDLNDAYTKARLTEDKSLAEIQTMHDDYVTPAVDILAEGGATIEELHKFMYAMHAKERNQVVGMRNPDDHQFRQAVDDPDITGASGWSTNEALGVLQEFAAGDSKKLTALKRASAQLRAMLRARLRDQFEAGLIDRQTYDMLTKQFKYYVPLKGGDGQDAQGHWSPGGGGFDVRGPEFKSATGRGNEAENVIAHAIAQSEQSILRKHKNEVGKAVLRFVTEHDPNGENIAQIYWSGDGDAALADVTKAKDLHKRALDKKTGKVVSRRVPNPFQNRDDVLATKVGGKTYFIRFKDAKVGHAMRKISDVELGTLSKIVRNFTVWQSIVNTRANPAFTPINIIRDVMTGSIHLMDDGFSKKQIVKVNRDIPKAWKALWNRSRGKEDNSEFGKYADEYLKSGGKITFHGYSTFEDSLKKLQKQMQDGAKGQGSAKAAAKGLIKFVGDLNDAGENGIRLSAYVIARKEMGMTPQQAAFLARDLTVDFKKRGELGPMINSWYVFYNAALQGSYNIARRLRRSKAVRKAAVGFMFAGMMQHVWNAVMAGEDDDGENAYLKMLRNEPYKLERQMVFFIPGTTKAVTIPLAYGFNAMYHLGVQGAAMMDGATEPLTGLLRSLRVMFDAFNPIGSGSWLNMIAPTIGDPIADLVQNMNFFGGPIYPSDNPFDKAPPPDSTRSFTSTSPAAKWAAEFMNELSGGDSIEPGAIDIHPDTLEHLWGYGTGGLGRFISQTGETAGRAMQGEFEPKKTPYVRNFYTETNTDTHRSEYFRLREEVLAVDGYMRDRQAAGDTKKIERFVKENKTALRAIDAFKSAEKQRRAISKQRKAIEADDNLSRTEREKLLDELKEAELQIMAQARKAYAAAKSSD